MFARVNKKEVLLFLKPVDPVYVTRQKGKKHKEMFRSNYRYFGIADTLFGPKVGKERGREGGKERGPGGGNPI